MVLRVEDTCSLKQAESVTAVGEYVSADGDQRGDVLRLEEEVLSIDH